MEGQRLALDAVKSGIRIESVFVTVEAMQHRWEAIEILRQTGAGFYTVDGVAARAITDTCSSQGIFCTAFLLDKMLSLDTININGAYLALENIQDPGNMGTMLRTAEALGLDGAFLSSGCVDLFSPKVVRAAMGAVFRLPVLAGADFPLLMGKIVRSGIKVYATVANGRATDILKADFSGGVAIVIGNEGSGVTDESLAACTDRITIRMRGRAESLNAAGAAAIAMWEVARGR